MKLHFCLILGCLTLVAPAYADSDNPIEHAEKLLEKLPHPPLPPLPPIPIIVPVPLVPGGEGENYGENHWRDHHHRHFDRGNHYGERRDRDDRGDD